MHLSFCEFIGFPNHHHHGIYRGSSHSSPFTSLCAFCDLFPLYLLELLFLFLSSYFSLQMALVIFLCLIMFKPWLLQKLFSPCISHHLEQTFSVVSFCLIASPSIFKSHLNTSLLSCLCLLISLSLCYYDLFNFDKYLGIVLV